MFYSRCCFLLTETSMSSSLLSKSSIEVTMEASQYLIQHLLLKFACRIPNVDTESSRNSGTVAAYGSRGLDRAGVLVLLPDRNPQPRRLPASNSQGGLSLSLVPLPRPLHGKRSASAFARASASAFARAASAFARTAASALLR